MDPTNDPALRSFVAGAEETPFPIQNLPLGVADDEADAPAIHVRIGDQALHVPRLLDAGLLDLPELTDALRAPRLNELFAAGRPAMARLRARLSALLRDDEPALRDHQALRQAALRPVSALRMRMPAEIGDYTDFYSSREHATNVGTMFRGPENALMPNWLHLPVGYHGRASSVVLSGTPIHRPMGQTKADDAEAPSFGPCRLLDYELEMGFFTAAGNELGQPIPIAEAREHIAGMVLVNDWSARDIQKWEYVPLGPFLAKNFATTISPWVVTMDALEPFRVAGPPQDDPAPLPYLRSEGERAYDIRLRVTLSSAAMREAGEAPVEIARSNTRYLYWDVAQQLAHHTVTGCNVRPGDLLASGTISGPTPEERGSLLERTWRGTEPLTLPTGEERRFLQDGDELTLEGWCQGQGYRVGFGRATGRVLPARAQG